MTGEATSWRIRHRAVTESTNADAAAAGEPGDVFTAGLQTGGRGRLGHRWLSPPGVNLMMSAVIGVEGLPPEEVATLPLVVGLAVTRLVDGFLAEGEDREINLDVRIKWPNDILVDWRKICGILCERKDDRVIAGIGLNVNQLKFPAELEGLATSLSAELGGEEIDLAEARDGLLECLGATLAAWRKDGFKALWMELVCRDVLRNMEISVKRTPDDKAPVHGVCGGIQPDGSLLVGGERVYAGEAHVLFPSCP